MPTPDELAAQIHTWAEQGDKLADEVAALDDDPTPQPTPKPEPEPAPEPQPTPAPAGKPARPTGLTCVIGPDGRPDLRWDPAAGVTAWELHDLAAHAPTLRATVTEPRSTRSALKAGQQRRYVVIAVGPGGRSQPSDAIDVPPASGPDPAPQPQPDPTPAAPGEVRYPADIVGKGWYLTLPTGKQGSPETVHQPALATYSSKYCELTEAGDGVVFRAWHGGVTTANSPNPRSELRECNPDGTLAKWSAVKGRHSMTVEGQVNRLTKVRPHCVVAQVHGVSNDVTVARVEGDKLWLTDGNNTHGYLLDDAFTLGTRYSIGIDVDGGIITYRYNGKLVPFTLNSSDPGNYYKAGCYLQSNLKSAPTESTDEYAEVVIFGVTVTHS